MSTSIARPSTKFERVRFATQNLSTMTFQSIRGHATNSYDQSGRTTPLLATYGVEDLRAFYINPASNDQTIIGHALFSGKLKLQEHRLSFDRNFSKGLFFSLQGSVTEASFSRIRLQPTTSNGLALTHQELEQNPTLQSYINVFDTKYLHHPFNEAFLGPITAALGYAHHYDKCSHLDFIDTSFQIGLILHERDLDQPQPKRFVQPPIYLKHNNGILLQAAVETGLFEWLNVGASGLVIPYIPETSTLYFNLQSNNTLINRQPVLAHVHHHPLIQINGYIAAEELIPKISWLLGFSHTKQFKTIIKPHCSTNDQQAVIEWMPWHSTHITFELECNLAQDDSRTLPSISFIITRPIAGSLIYKTKSFAGQISLDICYRF